MKVLFLFNSYEEDGPGILMVEMITRLQSQTEIECWTAALSRGGALSERYEEQGIPSRVIGMKGYTDPGTFWRLYRFLKEQSFDAVLTNLVRPDIIGRYVARAAKVPVILSTEHGLHAWAAKGKILEKLVAWLYLKSSRFTDKTIAVSDFVRRDLIARGVKENLVVTIHNGIDTEKFKPLSSLEREMIRKCITDQPFGKLVGICGNLIERKGYGYFLDAIPMIIEEVEDAFFICIGDGPLRPQFEEQVRKEGLGSRVRFLGRITAATHKLIAAMDVLVQPSLIEPFGLVVAEAMACEVPVVVSGVGGLAELVDDGMTGYIVPLRDPESIADRIVMLLGDPDKAKAMGIEGRKQILQNFHIDSTTDKYIGLLRQVIKDRDLGNR